MYVHQKQGEYRKMNEKKSASPCVTTSGKAQNKRAHSNSVFYIQYTTDGTFRQQRNLNFLPVNPKRILPRHRFIGSSTLLERSR